MMTIKNYVRVQSIEEAYALNQKRSNRIIGGMLWLKMSNASINTAIDLCELGLDRIEENADCFSIGAMVSLRQLEKHEGLNKYSNGAVCKAVRDIVGVQFRNMATLGGSLYGRFGFSDVLTVFQAMDCYVELHKAGIIPLEEFAKMKRERDVLIRIIVKKHAGCYAYTAMRNSRTDFPVLAVAASCMEGSCRIVVGARPGRAVVLYDDRGALDNGIDPHGIEHFVEYALEKISVGSNSRGSSAYRRHLLKVLIERTLTELGGLLNGN